MIRTISIGLAAALMVALPLAGAGAAERTVERTGPAGGTVTVVRDVQDLRPVAARHVRVRRPIRRAAPVVVVPRVVAPRVVVRPRPLVRRPLLRSILRD